MGSFSHTDLRLTPAHRCARQARRVSEALGADLRRPSSAVVPVTALPAARRSPYTEERVRQAQRPCIRSDHARRGTGDGMLALT